MHKLVNLFIKTAFANTTLFLVAMVFAQPLLALEFECVSGGDRRFIRMELPGIDHLCEVSVTYESEERKVMWYADNDSSFCSEKTDELRIKYQSVWNFSCEQWPDHDGVDRLSARHRVILDQELKALIEQGKKEQTPFMVEGLKAAASPTAANTNDFDLLVVQFFLHVPETGLASDVTHIIRDTGVAWNTLAKIDTLAEYIDADEGYVIDSALISAVTGNGALEIITVLDSPGNDGVETNFTGCYGNQVLATSSDGDLVARTPHRYYCPNSDAADGG